MNNQTMSHSVLRRYTPPTCTLEILGKRSPLSRWMAQPALKDLRFRLSLDDPKLSKEEWVELRGDRVQLEDLAEAVSTYVQQLLEQPQTSLARIGKVSNSDTIAVLPQTMEQRAIVKAGQPNVSEIFLRSNGLLNHDLMLGSLANEATDSVVRLSTLQLFDLANALDDYSTEIVALPNLQEPRPNWVKSSPAWAQIAAVCLVVVGLSTSVAKLLDHSLTSSPTATSQGASSSDQQIANQIPPAAVDNAAPPAASNQKLPPPPPLGSTTPGTPGMPKVIVPSTIPSNPGVSNTLPQKPGASSSRGTGSPDTIALNPGVQRQAPSTFAAPAPAALKPELGDNAVAKRSANSAESSQELSAGSAPQAADSSAFDTMPQVAEARRYFQQRWNPPQGLTQTLEYTLVVSPNGSIQQIVPLGQASGDYVDRTNIPLVGEPFVAPIQGGRTARIRLVLSPDGKVQTFLE